MGKKLEKGTPKEIANRSKSKGLQKLKWFCEMCRKQCRDQNGYKCHLTSESHQRQLLLVAENTDAYVRQFSREFETQFLQLLKGSYGSKRVLANFVYQEYIQDKNHTHMNATRWHSLSGFVQYLGATGKCKIDKIDEKGWFIQYIDKEEALKKEQEIKKAKAEKDDEERQQEMILQRVQRALEEQGEGEEYQATELRREDENEKITLNLFQPKKPTLEELNKPSFSGASSVFKKAAEVQIKKEEPESEDDTADSKYDRDHDRSKDRRSSRRSRSRSRSRSKSRSRSRDRDRGDRKRRSRSRSRERDRRRDRDSDRDRSKKVEKEKPKKSALEEIKEMNERKKEIHNRKDHWLAPGIVVKVVTKKLGDDFYKAKGVVKSLIDDYHAKVELDDGTLVKLNQEHVETVIPKVGREMLILNGAYSGYRAILDSINEKKFAVNLTISAGLLKGREVQVAYEDASKLA